MASFKYRMPGRAAAGLNAWLCCIVLLLAITSSLRGASARSVLYNKSERNLVLISPDHHQIEVRAGMSIELEGAEQQWGLMIQDKHSGALAGPLDLPDHHSFEVQRPSTSNYALSASKALVHAKVGNLVLIDIGINQ